jgi:hypothetical protein
MGRAFTLALAEFSGEERLRVKQFSAADPDTRVAGSPV